MTKFKKIVVGFMLISAFISTTVVYAEETAAKPAAVTTANEDVSPKVLNFMVRHMSEDELFVEADAWLVLLKEAAKEVYATKVSIVEKNTQIEALIARDNNKTAAGERASVQQSLTLVKEEKATILKKQTKLRAYRKSMVARLDTVLSNITEKIGTDVAGKELDKVLPYRRYINTVSGISVEVIDPQSAWTTVSGWIMSEEGGMYWLINILKFIAILFLAMFVSRLLSRGASKALKKAENSSQLLSDFIANSIRKVVMFIGLLVGLSAMDINVAPIMAMIGAAGFVVAFALQGTLSNFASGLMIMFYRPYDIGDVVDVAGIVGTVESMTLVSTSIVTPDNRMMVVPNNSIWGNIITNVTHSDTRRVDLKFGIGYNDNMEKAEEVMKKILAEHPLVLAEPAAVVTVTELADSSVNFNCRPWVKTEDYWTVYSEVTRAVKEEFDKEGISIPYPQMDIHLDPAKA